MTKIIDIPRTGIFAWGTSSSSLPILATGTAAGALDESFSSEGILEFWDIYPDGTRKSAERSDDVIDGEERDGDRDKSGIDEMAGEETAGGADEDEEDDFLAEIKPTNQLKSIKSFKVNSRFNRLVWGNPIANRSHGLLVAGMETGELSVYDPAKILGGSNLSDSTVFQATRHKGPVRGLDFNHGKKQLLASGSSDGEIFIWDMNSLSSTSTHYTPGSTPSKPGDITSLAWNTQHQSILASSLSSGYTIIWDLRSRKQIRTLSYGGAGSAGGMSGLGFGASLTGGRAAMSSVLWHPENPMSIITASDDDASPVVMVWDLKNSEVPERILTGHDKGILSLSWCKQDPDLLLSSGKDNRTILWNPQSSEMLGELPVSDNWVFQTAWNPRNPDILATASYDGKISVESLQTVQSDTPSESQPAASGDLFNDPSFLSPASTGLSLQRPPKWLRRPISASFGFGGALVSTSNLPSATGANQSASVHIRTLVTQPDIIERAERLQVVAGSKEDLGSLCEERTKAAEGNASEVWKALSSLFTTNSREELISLLGFSKEEVAEQVATAINKFKSTHDLTESSPTEPAVEATALEGSEVSATSAGQAEATESEFSIGDLSDATKKTEGETEASEAASLFTDDGGNGTPQTDAAADIFSSLGTLRSALPTHVNIPHVNDVTESAAATVGSATSSVHSESLKVSTFKIYPTDESEVDRLITRALVLGDFKSAVSLCLSSDRYADAILLAARGGEDLLHKTRETYFRRQTTSLPYLRLFQSIVSDDLTDVVQNADLSEWQEIFVVLCTFAKAHEFNNLAEQLGQRLEHQYRVSSVSEIEETAAKAKTLRKNAMLCYLAARKLEKVVTIWADEMKEEEQAVIAATGDYSRYAAHAQALQSFIEKVTVFQSATGYVDKDLATPTTSEAVAESGARTYRLASLYERYFEYADLLATQGLVKTASKYMDMTPSDFKCEGKDSEISRQRFLANPSSTPIPVTTSAFGATPAFTRGAVPMKLLRPNSPAAFGASQYTPTAAPAVQPIPAVSTQPSYQPYTPATAPSASASAPATVSAGPYGVPNNNSSPYGQPATSAYGQRAYGQQAYGQQAGGYGQPAAGSYGAYSQPGSVSVPPPPRGLDSVSNTPPLPPAATRRDISGWNDAPPTKAGEAGLSRPPSAAPKPNAITSPFPNSPAMTAPPMSPGQSQQPGNFFPPPPRGNTPGQGLPPPPRAGTTAARPPPPPAAAPANAPPPRAAPPPGPPRGPGPPPLRGQAQPPRVSSPLASEPPRVMSPPSGPPRLPSSNMAAQAAARPPPPSQTSSMYAPPPGQASSTAAPPSSNRYAPSPASQPSNGPAGFRSPPPAANQPLKPPPPPPAAPATPPAPPRHPAGDRSHIPFDNLPIFEQIQFLFEYIQTLPAPNPQIAQELQRIPAKLDVLYDKLNNDEISADLSAKLRSVASNMENRNLPDAYRSLLNIITNVPTEGLLPALTALKLLMSIAMTPPQ
ncbi:wd40 repeat-like protein [Phaffia rhodozyma]|uniref:Protein transport protein SEC31 n=1 Tax=Phaffia rhodozyma TaxID=264483 RepID=A0A0F7SQD3_PHARH|nr:wd40 repeat-like protein [Phaffia rhodozyma]